MILLCTLPILAIMVLALRYYSHMLQLSSYQFQGYFRFLRSIPKTLSEHAAILVLGIATLWADKK